MVKQIQLYFFPPVGQSCKSGGETSFPMEIAVAGIQVEGALLICEFTYGTTKQLFPTGKIELK
jgi:hypothetical protein